MVIQALTRGTLLQVLAFFLLGTLFGATGSVLYHARNLDTLLMEQESLKSEVSEKENRILRLEQSLTTERHRVVRSILVTVSLKDPHTNLKVTKMVQDLLQDLIGEEIESLSPLLIKAIIDERVLQLEEGGRYALRLTLLALGEVMEVYVQAVPQEERISE